MRRLSEMNQVKTAMLLAAMTALFLFVGYSLGGRSGLVLAGMMALITNFVSYWWSDRIVLKTYGARELSPDQAPELFRIIRELCSRDGLPMPRVYTVPDQSPNAFATGRNPEHAAVAVTEGIVRLLDAEELKGVLGHELSHVKHRDTLISTVAATIAGALGMLTNMAMWGRMAGGGSRDDDRRGNPLLGLVGIILAPMAAAVIRMAISRSREYSADESGAEVSGNPMALASALAKIESWSQRIPMSEGSPTTAHLFIINPFRSGGMAQLFSTHPPTAQRIERLQVLARRMGGGSWPRVA
jgi:heat shock protein HtpX